MRVRLFIQIALRLISEKLLLRVKYMDVKGFMISNILKYQGF